MTPGAEGNALFAQAVALKAKVGAVEKLELESEEATRNSEPSKALALMLKARELLPNCALVQMLVSTARPVSTGGI